MNTPSSPPLMPIPEQPGLPAPQGPARLVRMNCEASRLLTRSAIAADQVMRRGMNRLGRGRLEPQRYQAGVQRLKRKIRELDHTIQEVLLMFAPGEGQAPHASLTPIHHERLLS